MARHEDRDRTAVLQRQAYLVEPIHVSIPEDWQVDSIVRYHSSDEGQLRQHKPEKQGDQAVGEWRGEILPG